MIMRAPFTKFAQGPQNLRAGLVLINTALVFNQYALGPPLIAQMES